jgi:hypothetical protein
MHYSYLFAIIGQELKFSHIVSRSNELPYWVYIHTAVPKAINEKDIKLAIINHNFT